MALDLRSIWTCDPCVDPCGAPMLSPVAPEEATPTLHGTPPPWRTSARARSPWSRRARDLEKPLRPPAAAQDARARRASGTREAREAHRDRRGARVAGPRQPGVVATGQDAHGTRRACAGERRRVNVMARIEPQPSTCAHNGAHTPTCAFCECRNRILYGHIVLGSGHHAPR